MQRARANCVYDYKLGCFNFMECPDLLCLDIGSRIRRCAVLLIILSHGSDCSRLAGNNGGRSDGCTVGCGIRYASRPE